MRIAIALLILGLLSFAAAGDYEREYRYGKGRGKDKGDKDPYPDKDDKYCKYDPKEDAGTADWDLIRQEIINEVILKDGKIDPIAPALVRLGFHLGGTFDKDWAKKGVAPGGSNGATIRFSPEKDWLANGIGIEAPQNALKVIKDRHPEVSHADLWTFASVVAAETMGSNPIPWKPGRVDYDKDDKHLIPQDPPEVNGQPSGGRLPLAFQTADEIRPIFTRMGLDDQKTVCVLGAHTLGGAQFENTLRQGTWTRTPFQFTNMFFKHLLEEEWELVTTGPVANNQFTNKGLQDLMMFHSDLALIQDKKYKYWVKKYAADEQLFFKDFSKCFSELLELGVPRPDYEKEGASWKGKGKDKCTCKAKWEEPEEPEDKDHCYRRCSKYDGDDKELLKCKCKCQEKGQRKDYGKDKSYEKRKSHKGYCKRYKDEDKYKRDDGKDILKCKCKCQEKEQRKYYGKDKYEKGDKECEYSHKDKSKGHKRKYKHEDEDKDYGYDHKDKSKDHKRKDKYEEPEDEQDYEHDYKDKSKNPLGDLRGKLRDWIEKGISDLRNRK